MYTPFRGDIFFFFVLEPQLTPITSIFLNVATSLFLTYKTSKVVIDGKCENFHPFSMAIFQCYVAIVDFEAVAALTSRYSTLAGCRETGDEYTNILAPCPCARNATYGLP